MRVAHDWSDDPAIYFLVVLSDEATSKDRLEAVTDRVRETLSNGHRLDSLDHISYFKFRGQSEQAKLQEKAWD